MYTGRRNLERLLRSFYHSHKFLTENGGDFDFNTLTDIPSHSWSYPSIMASAGLKYLVLPCNNDLGPILLIGRLHEKSPFWWEGPDGQRVLTWYSRMYHQVQTLFGLPPKVAAGHDTLPIFLQAYTRPDYNSDGVIIFGSQVENTDLYREQATLAGDWNEQYAYPKLRFSGVAEGLRYIAGQMGNSIPVIRGDGGPYWDVGYARSPYYTAITRENEHRILAAEKFSTISSLINPRIWPDREAMDQVWKGLFRLEEHTGGGGRTGTLRAPHTRNQAVIETQRLTEHLLARSMSAIADYIPLPSGTIVVFNPLNWPRSQLVELNLLRNQELVNLATNQAVPLDIVSSPPRDPTNVDLWLSRDTSRHRVRFLAADVPAVGYRCYAMRQIAAEPPAPAVGNGSTLENALLPHRAGPVQRRSG